MRLAERWVIVGYSLPAEDLAIRSMFLRASRGRRIAPQVDIFDVGAHPEIEQRYQLILKNVSYDGGGFEKFIKEVTLRAAGPNDGTLRAGPRGSAV